jgi:hypothetical protein
MLVIKHTDVSRVTAWGYVIYQDTSFVVPP